MATMRTILLALQVLLIAIESSLSQKTTLLEDVSLVESCDDVKSYLESIVDELRRQSLENERLRTEMRFLKREMSENKNILTELSVNISKPVTTNNSGGRRKDKKKNRNRNECSDSPCRGEGRDNPDQGNSRSTTVVIDRTRVTSRPHAEEAGGSRSRRVPYKDCTDIWRSGARSNGTYSIQPLNMSQPFEVYCEMYADEAWTVIQRRETGQLDFFRNWTDYRNGFGDLNHEFWLGNEKIYHLTNQAEYKLGIDMWDWRGPPGHLGNQYYAESRFFHVDDEERFYSLHVPSDYYAYSGFGGSGLRIHRGPFSTYDRNNLRRGDNCAIQFHCGWWFTSCVTNANLNGRYYPGGYEDATTHERSREDMHWPNVNQSLQKSVMKVQRKEDY